MGHRGCPLVASSRPALMSMSLTTSYKRAVRTEHFLDRLGHDEVVPIGGPPLEAGVPGSGGSGRHRRQGFQRAGQLRVMNSDDRFGLGRRGQAVTVMGGLVLAAMAVWVTFEAVMVALPGVSR